MVAGEKVSGGHAVLRVAVGTAQGSPRNKANLLTDVEVTAIASVYGRYEPDPCSFTARVATLKLVRLAPAAATSRWHGAMVIKVVVHIT